MRRGWATLAAAALLAAGAAVAEAPLQSPVPVLRPAAQAAEAAADPDQRVLQAVEAAIVISPVPVLRPEEGAAAQPAPPVAPKPDVVLAGGGPAVRVSPRPGPRPPNLQRRSVVRASGMLVQPPPPPTRTPGRVTVVCGDPSIIGQPMAPIPGRIAGCRVANPVRVTSVGGISLSQAATLDCPTAQALRSWVDATLKPSVGRLGGGVASLQVAAHYSCRTRNNQPGAKVSEHGRGKAIDISAINLRNGQSLTVLKGWRDGSIGPVMKRLHSGACGTFGTVLGPNSDRFHQDHFHFDTARHGNGAYCR
ncbi:extensin-like domain-containing protein [Anianabacter salinae]|uniref:extensin-like domain-containing protein n=1 Tax=Anianabacter salinae TaxID=2851023 RepID=UPI00225DE288|nr:extensin family protein [Anianabacter salinae]MBV0911230.1 extensin family protein [Anianabacter salinae]